MRAASAAESGQRKAELLLFAGWIREGMCRWGVVGESEGRKSRMLHKKERVCRRVHFKKETAEEDRTGSLDQGLPAPMMMLHAVRDQSCLVLHSLGTG
jgi:hypothetical protein